MKIYRILYRCEECGCEIAYNHHGASHVWAIECTTCGTTMKPVEEDGYESRDEEEYLRTALKKETFQWDNWDKIHEDAEKVIEDAEPGQWLEMKTRRREILEAKEAELGEGI